MLWLVPAPSTDERPSLWWIPLAELGLAALWLFWGLAPPPVSSFGSEWLDLIVVPAAVACLFGVAVVAIWRGIAPTGVLAWVGLTALALILVLHAYIFLIMWTFPADF